MKKKGLNIWIINHYAGNLKYGMEYRHFFLARHLRAAGHSPKIISSSFHHLFTELPVVNQKMTFETFEEIPFVFIRTPRYEGNGIGRLKNILIFSLRVNREYKNLEKEFGRPDVLLGSSPHPFVYSNLSKLRRVYGIPALYEVRDLWPQMLIELGSISKFHPLSLLFYWIERRALLSSDGVISLWHSADEYMLRHGLTKERYHYLPNGIELDAEGGDQEIDSSHPLMKKVEERKSKGKFLVGYGGSHGYANPLSVMIEACKLLKKRNIHDVEFFLVGDGPDKDRVVSQAKALKLENIHFHGYVAKPVIMAFYKMLDVAFMGLRDLPLFKYGPTPNKLMDYLAAGKPIIYAINSSFDPVQEVGAGVSIPSDDPEQLVEAIIRIKALSGSERERMGRAGRRYAEQELNFKTIAGKLADVAQRCIEQRTS